MTYAATETSQASASPLELYRFVLPGVTWLYCDGPSDVTYNGDTYAPLQITRGALEVSPNRDRGSLTITVPRDAGIAGEWIPGVPESPVSVTVFRRHILDTDLGTVTVIKGRVMQAAFIGATCELRCEHIASALQRSGLRALYQTTCRHALYGPACGANREGFRTDGAVTVLAGTVVTSTAFAGKPANYFAGGILAANGTRRLIASSTGSTVTLLSALPGLGVGSTFTAFAGCDRTVSTCHTKFANAANFGGFPWIPSKNPFSGEAIT